MEAVIIAIGDELISGSGIDTNSSYLSQRLLEKGIIPRRHITVGDNIDEIAKVITDAVNEAELVITTGGLGPTRDDLTRQALAKVMGVDLVEDARSAERIKEFFIKRSRQMSPSNLTQALKPAGTQTLDNDIGTAPGIAARYKGSDIYLLPGPPNEMKDVFEKRVFPQLPSCGAIIQKTLHTFGIGESVIGEKIADLMTNTENFKVGTAAKGGQVSIRITAKADNLDEAKEIAEKLAKQIHTRLGNIIFGQDEQTLQGIIGDMLKRAGKTLATAESCTGGMLGEMITSIPGASEYFLGGVVSYSNAAKINLLTVPADLIKTHGAVSEPVAEAMAMGVKEKFKADFGIGITGIAGPTGGSAEKPVGLVFIGLADDKGVEVHKHIFPGERQAIRQRACLSALNYLRLKLSA